MTGLVEGFQKQRAGTTGGVIDGLFGTGSTADAYHLSHDAADFGGSVELAFGLAALCGKVLHKVLVGVAQEVVAPGPVVTEVEVRVVEQSYKIGQAIHHVLALTQLIRVVEVGYVDHALEAVGFCQFGDDDVDPVADVRLTLEGHQVRKAPALGYHNEGLGIACIPIGNILDE